MIARLIAISALSGTWASASAIGIATQIDGVEGPIKDAVTAAAQITQYSKRDVSAAQAHRLYASASKQIISALEAYGYYNAKVDGELTPASEGFVAVIHVHPGEPTTISALDITLPEPARDEKSVAKALADFVPRKGQAFNPVAYERSKATLQAALLASGYLDSSVDVHRVEITRTSNSATIALKWTPGTRYRYGPTTFSGDQFLPGTLDRYLPWHEGDFYLQAQLLRLQQRLTDANYFAVIDVHPDVEHAHDGVVPITVNLGPAKRNVYTAGVFVDTDIGVGIKGGVTRRWINQRGHKAKVEVELAQRLKTIAGTYTIPLPGDGDRAYNFGTDYRDENTDTTKSRTASLVANETREWLGFERTLGLRLQTGDFSILNPDGIKALNQTGNSTLLYPEIALEKKEADDPLFVRRGYSFAITARAAPGLLSDTHFAQVRADAKWIRGIGEHQRVILRGSLGATSVGDFDKLPPDLRFFAGGDRTIRGYAYQTIGPQNANGLVIGGQDLIVGSAEYEYYFKPNWGVATFVDSGDAFTGLSNFKTRIGTGIGLRWRSPVGMLRMDLGTPVNDPFGATGIQLHLVIGPDL